MNSYWRNIMMNRLVRKEYNEFLYADDLVLMAPTMEHLGRRVAGWRVSLLDKGLRMNQHLLDV